MPTLAGVGNLIAWARDRFARNETVVRLVSNARTGMPLGPVRDLRVYFRAYEDNTIWRCCVDEKATSYAEAPLVAGVRNRKGLIEPALPGDPFGELLERPNPEEKLSAYGLRFRLIVDYANCGNAAVRVIRSDFGMPVRLYPLQMLLLKQKAAKSGRVERYVYGDENGGGKIELPPEDVIHIKAPDPRDDFWGMPPGGRAELRFDDLTNRFALSYWDSGGVPSLLIKIKQAKVSKEKRHQLEDYVSDRYGPQGTRVMAHDSDVEVQPVGSELGALKLAEIFGHSESRICAAHGVPAIVIGARIGLQYGTYANYKSARRSFWEETMSPLYSFIGSELTVQLAAQFGREYVCYSDTKHVEAMQESQEDKRRFGLDGWNAGALTLDEFRTYAGLPLLGGDQGGRYKMVAGGKTDEPATEKDGKGLAAAATSASAIREALAVLGSTDAPEDARDQAHAILDHAQREIEALAA